MAKTSRSKKSKGEDQSSGEEQYEDQAQGQRSASHLKIAENMLNASRKRREAKRRAIETEHMQRVDRIRARIESFHEARNVKVAQMQAAQWEQLGTLLKTRKAIEKAILKNTTLIEQATLNMARELDTMYAARHDDILEMDTTGNVVGGTQT